MKKLVIGSRDSRLALEQAEYVRRGLALLHPDIAFEIKTYKTKGDRILDRTLESIGGKGLFTRELELALLAGEADLLVHSLKDMPAEPDGRIPIAAVSPREDARDVLVLPEGKRELSGPIGTASPRRALQLARLYPGHEIRPVRGNVPTRLQKLDSGEYGALCLAAAGLRRLGLEGRISRIFETDEMLPAACQGTLAIQTRADFDKTLLLGFCDENNLLAARCERSFVRTLGGGCTSPSAAYAETDGETLTLRGLYAAPDGSVHTGTECGSAADAGKIGERLALRLMRRAENG